MLSIAVRRYVVGSRGKWEGGGVPGRRGWRGEGIGGGDRRRWWRIRAMFCMKIKLLAMFCKEHKCDDVVKRKVPYTLSRGFLAIPHEKIGHLLDQRIIPMLHMHMAR